MEPEGSLPCSHEPSTGPYLEPDQSNPSHPILTTIHFNTVHPPTSWSSQWSLSFWLSHKYNICIPLLPIRATCPAHHSNYTWRRVQVMKLLIMHFLQPPVTSSLFGPNILLNTLFPNALSLCSSLNIRDHVSHPYRTTCEFIVLCCKEYSCA
jgi:hypothetical protein